MTGYMPYHNGINLKTYTYNVINRVESVEVGLLENQDGRLRFVYSSAGEKRAGSTSRKQHWNGWASSSNGAAASCCPNISPVGGGLFTDDGRDFLMWPRSLDSKNFLIFVAYYHRTL